MSIETIRQILSATYRQPLFRHAAITAGIMLGIALLADWVAMPSYTKHAEAIEVPDATSMPLEEAKAKLEKAGFRTVAGEERFSSQYPSGYVLEHSPRPLAKVKGGRRIYLVVSLGERRVEVPLLIERSERDGLLLLNRYGLVLGEVNYVYSNYYAEGTISAQSVPPRTTVSQGARVSITVSIGREPNEFVVPSVSGRPFADAAQMIRKAGLVVGSVRYEDVADLLPETVIAQSIEAGTKVEKGTKIDLVVSRLPIDAQPR